jgi:hypothetical protein
VLCLIFHSLIVLYSDAIDQQTLSPGTP